MNPNRAHAGTDNIDKREVRRLLDAVDNLTEENNQLRAFIAEMKAELDRAQADLEVASAMLAAAAAGDPAPALRAVGGAT